VYVTAALSVCSQCAVGSVMLSSTFCRGCYLDQCFISFTTVIHLRSVILLSYCWTRSSYCYGINKNLYLLSGDDLPMCKYYGLPLTVKHILVECTNVQNILWCIFLELCQSVGSHAIVSFVNETFLGDRL